MDEEAFGNPRDFLKNQFVCLVISPRAKGLSIGVNVNPAARCNFNCMYCEVDRSQPARAAEFDVDRMMDELRETLQLAQRGHLRQQPRYAGLPPELLQVRHVALSGDGEPTLSQRVFDWLTKHSSRPELINAYKLVVEDQRNTFAIGRKNVDRKDAQ